MLISNKLHSFRNFAVQISVVSASEHNNYIWVKLMENDRITIEVITEDYRETFI